jgi:rare lipoprotein A
MIMTSLLLSSLLAAPSWNTTSSWYSRSECVTRRNPEARTASGEVLDDMAMTCAHPTLPFNTVLRVSYNNKSILVRVNDRGPANRLVRKGRCLDLTKGAFSKLAPLRFGLINVKVERMNDK